jgi:hypothetical protein
MADDLDAVSEPGAVDELRAEDEFQPEEDEAMEGAADDAGDDADAPVRFSSPGSSGALRMCGSRGDECTPPAPARALTACSRSARRPTWLQRSRFYRRTIS